MAKDNCETLCIPEKLWRKRRGTLSAQPKCVYRRFRKELCSVDELYPANGELCIDVFPLINDSYNRADLSEPNDVLLSTHYSNCKGARFKSWGILALNLGGALLGKQTVTIDEERVDFCIQFEHTPSVCNYAHTEMRILPPNYTGLNDVMLIEPDSVLAETIRVTIIEHCAILKPRPPKSTRAR